MASKEELEAREGECSTAADFAALAKEAAGVDKDYAKSLVEKAEMQCQMPPDYIAAAEGALAIGDEDYAKDLYSQAEDACFEPMEFAALGFSLAKNLGDKEKGRELLERAAGEASKLDEFLAISGYAKEGLGDEELAASLLAKVEEKAKGMEDYVNLARTLKEQGNEDMAREFYKKAARFCDDLDATVAYAKGIVEIFGDTDWARSTLEEAETDCQFPKDFAALATGFKEMFDDQDKVAELMEQAAEFAMSGEENLDLAKGYWNLLGDKDKAVAAFEKALPEINDKAQLLELAAFAAAEMDAKDLAKAMYAKAEEKMSSAAERLKLAEAVLRDTGDKELTLGIYKRAMESLTQPNDLISLGANIVDALGDKETAAAAYRKALGALSDFGQYLKLLDSVAEKLDDKDFAREILEQAAEVASGTPEFLELTHKTMAVLGDKDLARRFLSTAEEQVTSVGEMKSVVEAVETHFADDADWIALVKEKLERREANQEKYAVFQAREAAADTTIKILKLADAVMAELDDRFYAQKLLVEAQKRMEEEGWELPKARLLMRGVSRHLGDNDWAMKVLDDAAARAQSLADLVAVCEMALEDLSDKEAAAAKVKGYLQDWEAREKDAYGFVRLARAVFKLLGDGDWARTLLAKAADQGGDHLLFAELARVARDTGDEAAAQAYLDKAVEACSSAAGAEQLVRRLSDSGFTLDQVRQVFEACKDRMATPQDRLAWAEELVDLFGDREAARRVYEGLAGELTGEAAAIYRRSRKIHVENRV